MSEEIKDFDTVGVEGLSLSKEDKVLLVLGGTGVDASQFIDPVPARREKPSPDSRSGQSLTFASSRRIDPNLLLIIQAKRKLPVRH